MNELTTLVRDRVVLAKQTPYGVSAKTYANLTGAQKAAEKVGGVAFRWPGSRPFFVWIRTMPHNQEPT